VQGRTGTHGAHPHDEQREAVDHAKSVAGIGSLIPGKRSYQQHLRFFERETARIGLSKTHGLRHAYVHTRFKKTYWPPTAGGRWPFKEGTQ